jgi:hypothetical protein
MRLSWRRGNQNGIRAMSRDTLSNERNACHSRETG